MIPTYNPRADYLEKTLRSVLQQDPGADKMQIEVVDDCSRDGAPVELVRRIAGDRIAVHSGSANLGLAGCWNTCIERSHGEWVHILHQDDYVLPGFYERLAQAANCRSEVSLIATRSFYVDEDDVITDVTPRMKELELGGRALNGFLYQVPIQCAGVAIRRSFYEAHGGFLPDLKFVLDWEMWARAVGVAGGLIIPEVLACYRFYDAGETGRLARTAETLRDHQRLHDIFARRYKGFDAARAADRVCWTALERAAKFAERGDVEAAQANLKYWQMNAPLRKRLRKSVGDFVRGLFR
jgi:glycosyltransferase involved in cell wall biosynthesis